MSISASERIGMKETKVLSLTSPGLRLNLIQVTSPNIEGSLFLIRKNRKEVYVTDHFGDAISSFKFNCYGICDDIRQCMNFYQLTKNAE